MLLREFSASKTSNRMHVLSKAVLLTTAVLFFAVGYLSAHPEFLADFKTAIRSWTSSKGYNAFGQGGGSSDLIHRMAKAPGKAIFGTDLPLLEIDLSFESMQKLHLKRDEALALGRLIQEDDDFVSGKVRYEGRTIPVKLRLKGDGVDHLTGDAWSFRVETKGDDQILGMRRLSIQPPVTRGYHAEPMFLEDLRRHGLVTLRYRFVRAQLNGSPLGTMAVEEHFSEELLESNARREGPIIRFDESLLWADTRLWNGPFHDFRNAQIDGFRMKHIEGSPALLSEYRYAVSQMRSFVSGSKTASEVFDVAQMSVFIAVSEIWGSSHSLRWHNLRFYLNPITLKLEPIPFDASLGESRADTHPIATAEPLVAQLFKDPAFRAEYLRTLRKLCEEVVNGNSLDELRVLQDETIDTVSKQFYLLDEFPLDRLMQRALQFQSLSDEELTLVEPIPATYPRFVHASLIEDGGRTFLELSNAIQRPVVVDSVVLVDESGVGQDLGSSFSEHWKLPMTLAARPIGENRQFIRVDLGDVSVDEKSQVRVKVETEDQYQLAVEIARPYVAEQQEDVLPVVNVEDAVRRNEFLSIDKDSSEVRISPGDWQFSGSLVVPRELDLVIPAGTTIHFEPGALVASYGAVRIGSESSAEGMVELRGLNGDAWKGLIVMESPRQSTIANTIFDHAAGVGDAAWALTGAVTFFKSDVRILSSIFSNNTSEDSLNIINSNFTIEDTVFSHAVSDALDADFSFGRIVGGRFDDIGFAGGGDGVDVSGSKVSIEGTEFTDVYDKAISVGEGSFCEISNVSAIDIGTGVASKDGSHVSISASIIRKAQVAALFAYTKKPQYGGADIKASKISFNSNEIDAIAQIGSEVFIDDVAVRQVSVDVDELYETVMKKGAR